MEITIYIISAICLFMAIVIICGKGDWMIAGYNTASKEEREQYDIKRLRIVISAIMAIVGSITLAMVHFGLREHKATISIAIVTMCSIGIIFANTWAKKR